MKHSREIVPSFLGWTLRANLSGTRRGFFRPLLHCKSPTKCYTFDMKVIVHLSKEDEAKALPILLRHSPGMVLQNRTYVLSEDALRALRKAGVRFSELSREATAPSLEEVVGESV
jgi:hypothetical protein